MEAALDVDEEELRFLTTCVEYSGQDSSSRERQTLGLTMEDSSGQTPLITPVKRSQSLKSSMKQPAHTSQMTHFTRGDETLSDPFALTPLSPSGPVVTTATSPSPYSKSHEALHSRHRARPPKLSRAFSLVPERLKGTSSACGNGGIVSPNFFVFESILQWTALLVVLLTLPFSLPFCFKVIAQYERAVFFRLGRLLSKDALGPGLVFCLPCLDSVKKVDLRTLTFDVPTQEVLTRDSVTVAVDAVVYYRIHDPVMSVVNIEDVDRSTRLLAQTTLRNVLGTVDLYSLLTDREDIAGLMRSSLDISTETWGVKVERVDVKDVRLPTQLQRAMAAEAEATREAKAKIIAARGEKLASVSLREAAVEISACPVALQLRYLQTLNNISAEKNSTIIFPFPSDLFTLMEKLRSPPPPPPPCCSCSCRHTSAPPPPPTMPSSRSSHLPSGYGVSLRPQSPGRLYLTGGTSVEDDDMTMGPTDIINVPDDDDSVFSQPLQMTVTEKLPPYSSPTSQVQTPSSGGSKSKKKSVRMNVPSVSFDVDAAV